MIASQVKKKEQPTFETLMASLAAIKIQNKPPILHEMKHTSNFIKFISPSLNNISGHRNFSQFKFRKEGSEVSMYVKSDELDEDWRYPRGVKLFKSYPVEFRMDVSNFRENSDYSSIFESVSKKYFPTLSWRYSEEEVQVIKNQWESRISSLIESEPKKFETFKITELRKCKRVSGFTVENSSRKETALTAVFHPVKVTSVKELHVTPDTTVVIYTRSKSRPWVGIVKTVSEGTVQLQWLKKEKRCSLFYF